MASEPIVSLHLVNGQAYHFRDRAIMAEVAASWANRLVRRNAWSRIPDLRKTFASRCRYDLQRLCPELAQGEAFERLASAGLIEIRFLPPNSKIGWDIPWEFLLSSATENERESTLLVIRQLVCEKPGRDLRSGPQTLLVHKNNPGYLGRTYRDNSLKREEKVVEVHLGLRALTPLHNESLESTRRRIATASPDVIHVSGVDGKQAGKLAPQEAGLKFPSDSLIVTGENGDVAAATADLLAPALCAGASKPAFVGLNFVYSGADIAPAMVLNGAYGALGFHNDFDDIAAEVFYFNFYLAWRLSHWNLLDAFRLAWYQSSTRDNECLRGTGIVLWSRESLLDIECSRGSFDPSGVASPPADLLRGFEDELDKPIPQAERRNVKAFASPIEQINYSLLHNNKSLFQYFYIRKPQCVGSLKDLKVDVALHAGPDAMSYHTSGDLSGSIWPLDDIVRLPLTSTLARSLREITHTQLSVRVEWNGHTVFDRSFPVSLMPIEQWQNDAANRKWLPSFVLPRDPSVSGVIDSAQPYLTALADSIEAGFDGYQNAAVGNQVTAIWWALIGNLSLSYIGAPPAYGAEAQRLRSPSSVLKGRRGTCIDLALLLASCLEYIDLHPLLFLLKDHAFAGYYRKPESSKDVYEWMAELGDPDGDPWVLGADFHSTMMTLIDKGEIVPVETVGLTKKWGMKKAVDEAKEKLRLKGTFEWMMDVKLARDRGVTPLPLLEMN
jgi:hypothetical protein